MYTTILVFFLVCVSALPRVKDLMGPLSAFSPLAEGNAELDAFIANLNVKREVPAVLTPVIIVPSLIGTQLWATLENKQTKYWYCDRNSAPFLAYINEVEFYPLIINCFLETLTLSWKDGVYSDFPGVSINGSYEYGNVEAVEYIDIVKEAGCWNYTIAALSAYGYVPGLSVRAAPYDWRLGPDALGPDYLRLAALIEDTFTRNNNTPVALISLSMGANFLTYFLSQQPALWKEKYITSWTSWSGAFGGSAWAPMATVSTSSTFKWYDVIPQSEFLQMAAGWTSLYWMYPNPTLFPEPTVFNTALGTAYSPANYSEMLGVSGNKMGAAFYASLSRYPNATSLPAPGVPLHCVYGYGLPTPASLTYNTSDFVFPSSIDYVDGDGTVTSEGLADPCTNWKEEQSAPITMLPIFNMSHGGVVANVEALQSFLQVLGLL